MTMAGRIVTLVVGASVLVMLHASEGAPTPHLFPGPVFSVDMTITRFAANPANSTAVNVTLGAIMALNGSSAFLKTWHAGVDTTSQSMASATWTNATSNSSTVQVSWRASARDPSSRQLCFHAPLFKSQVSTVDDLSTFSAFAPLATYQGMVTWRGMTVRKYSVGSLILYSSPNASNVAVGLWDGKANEYQFTRWHSGDAQVVPPPPRGCRRVSAQVTESRPSWWVAAADAAGVVAQDAGVSVVHGDDTIWCVRGVLWLAFAPSSCTATLRRMFGDSFLTKSSPACTGRVCPILACTCNHPPHTANSPSPSTTQGVPRGRTQGAPGFCALCRRHCSTGRGTGGCGRPVARQWITPPRERSCTSMSWTR